MTQVTLETKLAHSDDIHISPIDNEILMANFSNDKYYSLNPVSSQIWELLEQPTELCEVCQSLLKQFEIDSDTCQVEVISFAQSMVDAQILKVV